MPRHRHRAPLQAAAFAAALATAGASHAAAFLSATGLFAIVDPQGGRTAPGFNFTQATPIDGFDRHFDGVSDRAIDFAQAHLGADYDFVSSQTGGAAIRVAHNNLGTTTVAGFVQVGLHDELTITASSPTPSEIILHRNLRVRTSGSASSGNELDGDNTQASASMKLLANGVGSGVTSLIDFRFQSVNDVPQTTGVDFFDTVFDYALRVDLNQLNNVDVALQTLFELTMNDVPGRESGNLNAGAIGQGSAAFTGGARVTDAAGNPLCGITITAASGADWGRIAACQGGGGAGAVPEPASWALMIMGFGGVGAAFRRRAALNAAR